MNFTDEVQPVVPVQQELKTLMVNAYVAETEYRSPTDAQLNAAQILFEKLLQRTFPSEDVQSWSSIGLKLQEAYDRNQGYAVVSEIAPNEGVGHGFYAVKMNPFSGELWKYLQAPHRPSDLYTHEIIFDMLTLNIFSGAAWSTTHRNSVDLCKETKSFYNAFTKAVAKMSNSTILQLHGFNKHSYEVDVDVIFSSTNYDSTPAEFHGILECARQQVLPWKLLMYPEEVDFLGGTSNINAELFYEISLHGKFIHFETSKELRDELRVNDSLILALTNCFKN